MVLIELHYKKPLTEIDGLVDAHRAFLQRYYDEGLLLLSGPKTPRTGGFILALTNDVGMMQNIMQEDPYQKNNLADYTFSCFEPKNFHPLLTGLLAS